MSWSPTRSLDWAETVHVIATAGHVDHGKSTLVRALTGTDPDRWEEEKVRGLTIDLGFAHTSLPSGRPVSFVDVPGHVRFLRNMLAGVGAVDGCLLVVAATEGWKPQSEEHLRILDLLGIGGGLVAITHASRVDAARLESVTAEVSRRVQSTFLAAAATVAVDSVTGVGLDQVRGALDSLLEMTPPALDRGRPRLWVDRSFAVRGAGTVVTGTLAGGTLSVGDMLTVIGPGPLGDQGRQLRVRSLQTHGEASSAVGPGHRAAVNLAGIGHRQVVRGDALVKAGQWHPARMVDASLRPLASLGHPVSRRGAYALYAGSGEHAVRMRVIGAPTIEPGQEGLVRLHLPAPLPLLPGDRFILREHGRNETVGGGELLDVAPVLPVARAAPSRSIARVVAERGWVDADLLERLTGEHRPPNVGGRWVVDPERLAEDTAALRARLPHGASGGADVAGLDERQRALLQQFPRLWSPSPRAEHPWLQALEDNPWSPPDPWASGADRTVVRQAVRQGQVVSADGVYFAATAIRRAAEIVAGLLAEHPEGLTVSMVRDALGSTRKHVIPLLAHLDATGVTRRRGDVRVPGARLPAPHQP